MHPVERLGQVIICGRYVQRAVIWHWYFLLFVFIFCLVVVVVLFLRS